MSFYGNQYLEFTNFFYKFILKNAGVEIEQVKPNIKYDTFTIDSDGWISVNEIKEDQQGLILGHKDSINTIQEFNTFQPCSDSQKQQNAQLMHEGCITAYSLGFDEKGHIIKVEEQHYQLPEHLRWINLSEISQTT